MNNISQTAFSNVFSSMKILIKILLKFVPKGPINNIPALVQIMAWRRPGDKPLSAPMIVSLSTHICVTRPQWVNQGLFCVWAQPIIDNFKNSRQAWTNVDDFYDGKGNWNPSTWKIGTCLYLYDQHYSDVIMGTIASQITSLKIVYSIVYSDADQRKHQSSASLAFVWGIHRGPVNSPHKWPVTWKVFPFDDTIMRYHKYWWPGAPFTIMD